MRISGSLSSLIKQAAGENSIESGRANLAAIRGVHEAQIGNIAQQNGLRESERFREELYGNIDVAQESFKTGKAALPLIIMAVAAVVAVVVAVVGAVVGLFTAGTGAAAGGAAAAGTAGGGAAAGTGAAAAGGGSAAAGTAAGSGAASSSAAAASSGAGSSGAGGIAGQTAQPAAAQPATASPNTAPTTQAPQNSPQQGPNAQSAESQAADTQAQESQQAQDAKTEETQDKQEEQESEPSVETSKLQDELVGMGRKLFGKLDEKDQDARQQLQGQLELLRSVAKRLEQGEAKHNKELGKRRLQDLQARKLQNQA